MSRYFYIDSVVIQSVYCVVVSLFCSCGVGIYEASEREWCDASLCASQDCHDGLCGYILRVVDCEKLVAGNGHREWIKSKK